MLAMKNKNSASEEQKSRKNVGHRKSSFMEKDMRIQNLMDAYAPSFSATEPFTSDDVLDETKLTNPPVCNDQPISISRMAHWKQVVGQVLRFCMVGGLNTILDLLLFNCLLLLFPTQNPLNLVIYNSLAYAFGGINSFLLNKYWTFRHRQRIATSEIVRFIFTTILGICVNDVLLWACSNMIHLQYVSPTLWANVAKIIAIFGTFLISYTGMRLWVFSKSS
jgi:putative flippase GtrA